MNIIVFIKQVPDTVDVKINPETGNLDREGLKGVINPFDNNAIEAALNIKEESGGKITVISMGPPQSEESLRVALAMGCDEAILLSDIEFGGADTLATGYTLGKAVEKIGDFDLLLFGSHAIDADTGQTGPIVADFLDVPQITLANSIEIEDGYAICDRDFDDSIQRLKAKLPVAISVTGEINDPRYPSPIGIMQSSKKPYTVWNSDDLNCDNSKTGLEGSPSIVNKIFEPDREKKETVFFAGSIEEKAEQIVDFLENNHII